MSLRKQVILAKIKILKTETVKNDYDSIKATDPTLKILSSTFCTAVVCNFQRTWLDPRKASFGWSRRHSRGMRWSRILCSLWHSSFFFYMYLFMSLISCYLPQVENPIHKYDSCLSSWGNLYVLVHFVVAIIAYQMLIARRMVR